MSSSECQPESAIAKGLEAYPQVPTNKPVSLIMARCIEVLETWRVRTEEQSTPQLCAQICAPTTQKPLHKLAIKAASPAASTENQQTRDRFKNQSQRNSSSESGVMLDLDNLFATGFNLVFG